ncbi:hypothetical protein L227DRAFT_85676 [Lentinus tigrinus ALCF2SS1-6]|uniref:F-box domain-containing protein n=1 Tax=Lentinus tigrinus ALCF2SS1-6 TaxID=1328759 RepID=A0A5C2SC37_9APHY|nr:hypothetical protein L227DRAFT_85676 [Lentinus tigrinus ALCF2SS1-6]
MVSPSPRLPFELLEHIVDNIRNDDVDDVDFYPNLDEYRTFCACCLVCRGLLSRSRRNLLRRVCIQNMRQLKCFSWMLDTAEENRSHVVELIVFSIAEKPSPAESFSVMFAHKLPNLRFLQLRTEMGPVPDPAMRPAVGMHRSALACLSAFQDVEELQLFGLRFLQYKHFLRLVSSLPKLSTLQCMQLWFNPSGPRSASDLAIPDHPPIRRLRLSHIDLAFVPRVVMKGLLHTVDPDCIHHLVITPNKVLPTTDVRVIYRDVATFHNLESFTFFIAVTEDGAEYAEVLGLVTLLNRNVRTITLSHYLHGAARNHKVPKQSMIDVIGRNADALQRSLDPGEFSAGTRVILQFQGFHDSEAWWTKELEPILPKLFKVQNDRQPGRRYLSVENVTYSDWSPWQDDKDRSAPS